MLYFYKQGLSMSGSPGKIYALYTNGTLEEAKVLNTIDDKNPLRGPHGISIWEDPKSGILINLYSGDIENIWLVRRWMKFIWWGLEYWEGKF